MNRTIMTIVVGVMTALTGMAQQTVNKKFGKPTKEEMQMTVYEADSAAEAVVLCRLTKVEYTIQPRDYLVDYHEKVRIKILKPEGTRYANVVIPYYDDAFEPLSNEEIRDLKATAYNMEDGKVRKTPLTKDLIFKEQTDSKHHLLKFTIPQVRVGTVIEYEYTHHSNMFYQLHDWYAQGEIPVAYASLDMNIPAVIIFNMEQHGFQKLDCKLTEDNIIMESNVHLQAAANIKSYHYVLTGTNLKAMPKDQFVWCPKDYYAGVTAELRGFSIINGPYQDYTKTWDQVDELILTDNDIGTKLNDHSPLREEIAASNLSGIADQKERAAAVFQLVMSHVAWDGYYRIVPEKSTSATLKKGTGSNAEINLLLIQSLHDAGLEAVPVMLRTRDRGMLPVTYPTIQKLNTFVVGVVLSNGGMTYLDASATSGYLDVLPAPLLVDRARAVIKGKKSRWIDFQKLPGAKTVSVIEASISPDGLMEGTMTSQYSGQAAAAHREALRKHSDSTAYIAQLNGEGDMEVTSCRQENADRFAPSATQVIHFRKQGEASNGRIYISPFCLPPMKESPFTAAERLLPVEFPYPQSEQILVTLTLPEGYVMEDGPKATNISTSDGGIFARLLTSSSGRIIQVQYELSVRQMYHANEGYPQLRQIFGLLAEHSKDMLVLKRQE